jgi:predicted ATPase
MLFEDHEMLDNPQNDFRTTELDPDLLSTPFSVQTNWHVITGAPCCGKTTLIDQLGDKGFRTVAESARQYLEIESAKGRTIDEIHAKGTVRDRGIKDMQLEVERGLRAIDCYFLDRALPDSLAFFRFAGLNPNEILAECFHHCYASVFILDPLPFQLDDQRVEEFATIAGFLNEWHTLDYSALGYNVVRVPVLPPDERLAFVLERLSQLGLI